LTADCRWVGEGLARPERGLRAFGRVYAGWAYSHEFFHAGLYRALGFATLDALLAAWEQEHLAFDANDLLAMLHTWESADIGSSHHFGGDSRRALQSIEADTMLVSCSTDRYFASSDNEREAQLIPRCRHRQLDSPIGHCAFSPGKVPSAMEFLDRCVVELLAG
jgi:homoserine O-acetyltransferase/O-succinyltransferase